MWRVALKHVSAGDIVGWRWKVVQCWSMRKQEAFAPVRVERKNHSRKRLILLAPYPIKVGQLWDPLQILESTLYVMPEAQKLALIKLNQEVA